MYTIDRRLPQRSFLKYIYHDNGNKPPYIARVPFFENITVGESRKANYSQYSILADNEFDFEYVGTESRKFSLTFEINLLHLLQEAYDFINLTNPASSKFVDKEKFKNFYKTNVNDNKIPFSKNLYLQYFSDPEVKTSADSVLDELQNKTQSALYKATMPLIIPFFGTVLKETDFRLPKTISPTIQSYLEILRTLYHAESLNERLISQFPALEFAPERLRQEALAISDINRNQQIQQSLEDLTATLKVLDQVVYFTNIIRSSVLSKGKGTSVPPPLVYLNHGILYQNVPCICTDYNLSIDKNVTYDLPTLLPFTLKFSVNLVEALGYARKTEFMYNEIGGLEQTLVSEDLTRRYEEFVGEFDYGWTSVINEPFSLDHLASQK